MDCNFSTYFYRNFRVKVYGKASSKDSDTINKLAGLPLLYSLLGKVLCLKILAKVDDSDLEMMTFRLRRGLTIKVYRK
mgnify:CR=1 FL=1